MIEINPSILLVQIITFLVAVWVLWRFFWGPLKDFMKKRQDGIARQLEEAARGRQEAARLEEAYKKLLENINRERLEMLEKATRDGEKERSELIKKAHEETRQMLERARAEIAEERAATARQLRGEVASLAVMIAEKILKETVDKKVQERLLKEFSDELKL